MMDFPILETKRLILRKLTINDTSDVFNYFSKEEVAKYTDLEKFTTIKQAEKLINSFNKQFRNGIRWGILLKKNNKIIGSCGFHHCNLQRLDVWNYKVEIGYELTPEYWKKGIMTEALTEIIKYGFNKLSINRIEALIIPENIGSIKLIEKIGFKKEGLLKEYRYEKNNFIDCYIYSILKNKSKLK